MRGSAFDEAVTGFLDYLRDQRHVSRETLRAYASDLEQLRAEGIYQILTPDEVVARAKEMGDLAAFNLHPLCGGMPVDKGWECVQLYVDKVLPRV